MDMHVPVVCYGCNAPVKFMMILTANVFDSMTEEEWRTYKNQVLFPAIVAPVSTPFEWQE